jgi:hypothetical protein
MAGRFRLRSSDLALAIFARYVPTTARSAPTRHRIAAIGADGIGPEVIAAGLEVLEACAETASSIGDQTTTGSTVS